nr:MAG TPA: hypothetical protein [Caudoviricetes sp.]
MYHSVRCSLAPLLLASVRACWGSPRGGEGCRVPPERKRCVALPLTPDYIVSFPNAEHGRHFIHSGVPPNTLAKIFSTQFLSPLPPDAL